MAASMYAALAGQKRRNEKLLKDARYLGQRVRSQVLPLQVDIAKNRQLLGWYPPYTLEQGLKMTAQSLLEARRP